MSLFYESLCKPEFLTLLIAIILLSIMRSKAKYQAKKRRDEERELLKWQIELEQKASKLYEKERY